MALTSSTAQDDLALLPEGSELADFILPGSAQMPEAIAGRITPFYVRVEDGTRLRAALARTTADQPRGSIIFSPGRTEFIEKYLETIKDLTARGFNVLMIDPRGQGLSDRPLEDRLKSYISDFQLYADDFGAVAKQFAPLLPKPYVIMGHSMGGTIVLQALISGTIRGDAVIGSAPMLGLFDLETPVLRFMLQTAAVLGFDKYNLPFQRQRSGMPVAFASNKLTSDKDRYKTWANFFQSAPRLRVGQPTFGWIRASLAGMAYVNRNADKLGTPGLMVAAGGDPIVDPQSVETFAEKSGSDFDVIPGALHELFLERDVYRDPFLAMIDAFLERQKI